MNVCRPTREHCAVSTFVAYIVTKFANNRVCICHLSLVSVVTQTHCHVGTITDTCRWWCDCYLDDIRGCAGLPGRTANNSENIIICNRRVCCCWYRWWGGGGGGHQAKQLCNFLCLLHFFCILVKFFFCSFTIMSATKFLFSVTHGLFITMSLTVTVKK